MKYYQTTLQANLLSAPQTNQTISWIDLDSTLPTGVAVRWKFYSRISGEVALQVWRPVTVRSTSSDILVKEQKLALLAEQWITTNGAGYYKVS